MKNDGMFIKILNYIKKTQIPSNPIFGEQVNQWNFYCPHFINLFRELHVQEIPRHIHVSDGIVSVAWNVPSTRDIFLR